MNIREFLDSPITLKMNRDGSVDEATVKEVTDQVAARLRNAGAPEDLMQEVLGKFPGYIKKHLAAEDLVAASKRSVIDILERAVRLLEDIPDAVKAFAMREDFKEDSKPSGFKMFALGRVSEDISVASSLLSVAKEGFVHALECPCIAGGEHPKDESEAETIPPPPAPEASA